MSGTIAVNADGTPAIAAQQGGNFAAGIVESTYTSGIPQQYTTVLGVNTTPPPAQKFYTEEDLAAALAKVREQEKSKLYPQIDTLKSQLDTLTAEREARLKAEEDARKAAEDEKARKEKDELTLKQRLERAEQEFEAKIEAERQARLLAEAKAEKEREYYEFSAYMNRRLAEEADNIMPELQEFITGNNKDEFEASLALIKDRSARIIEQARSFQQQQRQTTPGTRVTVPGAGPTDINMGDNTMTPESIREMPMAEYIKNRSKLIGSTNGGRGVGMFG